MSNGAAPPTASAAASVPVRRPPCRRLRTYSFDPSLDLGLDTAVINLCTLEVPWEYDPATGRDSLRPGPVGEYVEVVDFDPASGCFYEPVDLDQLHVVAQDGLEPSEGNPQFHQQMVYAVAMTTIQNFERALGRRALWAPRRLPGEAEPRYVRRLRIYPHALREANAYYSPGKKALLFGYFPATPSDPGRHLPGGTVFTCLSHDVIAHETTHALLDGLQRYFTEPSNRDVLAFHEAFADLVALFQHFSHPEVLRHQIARTRGDLASQNLLAQLAQEFGQATGRHGALRDALGEVDAQGVWRPRPPDPDAIQTVTEPHDRGSLLVAAVFDAFLTIYRSRIADLLRIATSGTGVLEPGELHPDLVGRLAGEAASSAGHLLQMCIRALDYCPPIDVTFGEYLRALVTADRDASPGDERGYRIAVIEAFRRRGIYQRDVRSLSVDTLCWQPPSGEAQEELGRVFAEVMTLRCLQPGWRLSRDRFRAWAAMQRDARTVASWLAAGRHPQADRAMGLELSADADSSYPRGADGLPAFEVHSVRPARRVGPDGGVRDDLVVQVTQARRGYFSPEDQRRAEAGPVAGEPDFWFRGGCTLLLDPESRTVRYAIAKHVSSARRLGVQREYTVREPSLRATYFGAPRGAGEAEPFALLHRSWEAEEEPR